MTYQPNLYIFNIGNATARHIYHYLNMSEFGEIDYVETDSDKGCAYVVMKQWDINNTTATRMKLEQGKPLLLYYTETDYWKVYAYEHRGVEEEHKKRMRKITRSIKRKIDALVREREREQECEMIDLLDKLREKLHQKQEQLVAAHKRHTDTVNLYQQYEDNQVLQPHKKQKNKKIINNQKR